MNWIRREREARGLSQANLARLLSISQPKLSQWETGKANPSDADESRIKAVLSSFDATVQSGTLPEEIRPRSKRRIARVQNGDGPALRVVNEEATETTSERLRRVTHALTTRRRIQGSPSGIALFAGCGGMSLGFKQAGFDVWGFVEVDEGARAIYERNFPESVCLGCDIRGIGNEEVLAWKQHSGSVDVLFGGAPCQGFSLTGKRDQYDPRNELYAHFARIAGVLKPTMIVFENVRLLTSMKAPDNGLVLDRIQEAVSEAGYQCRYQVLNAQDYGVPQFRERLFIVGVRNGAQVSFPEVTHGPTSDGCLFSTTKRYVTFRDACGDLESLESGERSATDPLHVAVTHPEHVLRWLRNVPEGESAHNNPDPALRPPCGYNTTYKRIRWDEPCSTISTTFGMISGSRNVHPSNTRSLTIREAARCQTFPDDFQFCGTSGAIRTAIGNAVPPQLAKVVALHLKEAILQASPLPERRKASC